MMTRPVWQKLSVQTFFGDYNWQGPHAVLNQDVHSYPLDQRPWQCFTVQEFWTLSNWQGRSRTLANLEEEEATFSLTLTVGQFWQRFVWDGQPQIAVLPQLDASPSPRQSVDDNQTVSDFLNLF